MITVGTSPFAPPVSAQYNSIKKEMDPEKLKSIFQNQGTSLEDANLALGRLMELNGVKEYKNQATEDEKIALEQYRNFVSGESSDTERDNLASTLGMDKERLAEIQNKYYPPKNA